MGKYKIAIINQEKFASETLAFYKQHFDVASLDESDVWVTTAFDPIKTDRKVVIATNTTGLDHIDAPNAEIISLRGMDLSSFTAVPELIIGMAIYLTRIFKREEVKGKTIGIIGYGRIGKQLKDYALGVGMHVVAKDLEEPIFFPNHNVGGIASRDPDIYSLNITADEVNRDSFGMKEFQDMKDGVILLNSARPWLVNKETLKWALEHKLAGAWFDFDMPFQHPKLVTTPHLGGTTKESKARSEILIAEEVYKRFGLD